MEGKSRYPNNTCTALPPYDSVPVFTQVRACAGTLCCSSVAQEEDLECERDALEANGGWSPLNCRVEETVIEDDRGDLPVIVWYGMVRFVVFVG